MLHLTAKMARQVLVCWDKNGDSCMRNTMTDHTKLYAAFVENQRDDSGGIFNTIVTEESIRTTTAITAMILLILLPVNVLHIIPMKTGL